MLKKIVRLAYARNLEFFRDKEALAWNIIMPIFFVIAIALAFGHGKKDLYQVRVISADGEYAISQKLPFVDYQYSDNLTKSQKLLEQHQVDLLISDTPQKTIWFNPISEKSVFLHQVVQASHPSYTSQPLEGTQIRYLDWVFPGVLAVNLMYGALYGIGYVIVRYRKNGYLKRLQATPLSALEFLLAQITSRMMISTVMLLLVFVCCMLLLKPLVVGSWIILLLLYVLGMICLISLSLLLCSRITSEEFSRGMLEMAAWPMLLISGAWFSLEQAHYSIKWLSQILPLTHLISAAREVMLYGASLADIKTQLVILLGMTLLFLLLGSLLFKWRE